MILHEKENVKISKLTVDIKTHLELFLATADSF